MSVSHPPVPTELSEFKDKIKSNSPSSSSSSSSHSSSRSTSSSLSSSSHSNPAKDFSKGVQFKKQDGSGLTIAIVSASWNETIVSSMKSGCISILTSSGVSSSNILHYSVPGSYELPFAAKSIIINRQKEKKPIDAVVVLGCLIKGETMHFEYICDSVSKILQEVQLETGIPVVFGVLTCLTDEQAKARAGLTEKGHNHGEDYGHAAIQMAKMKFKPIHSKL